MRVLHCFIKPLDFKAADGKPRFVISKGTAWSEVVGTADVADGAWHQVVGSYDGSNVRLYVDGAQVGSTASSGNLTVDASALALFGDGVSSYYLNGSLDEVRVSLSTRSADWIAAQFNNHNSPSTFYSVSGATAGGGPASGQVHWLVSDQLGTPRMIFDQSGSLANVSRHDYLPFGEELGAGTGGRTTAQGYSASDGIRQHFISKERDTETGLDYFGARYFSSTQGRFTGVDPVGATKYHLLDPQLWNAYSYGLNNPLTIIDVDGRFPWTIFIRSFIFRSMLGVGGYGFRGDARGPSTDERATARIRMQFTLDYDRSQIPQDSIKSRSDTTTLVVPGGEISKEGVPRVQVGPVTVDNN